MAGFIAFLGVTVLTLIIGLLFNVLIRSKRTEKVIARHLVSSRVIAGDQVEDMFSGRIELLTESLLAQTASPERKRQYYSGGPLKWDIIASDADIRSDLEAVVLQRHLVDLPRSLQFLCILGESGSGKSTLAWRLAAQMYREHACLVLRVLDREDPDVWYRLNEFAYLVKRPFCVLADDLFRNPDVVRALCELRPDLPITVLATSQSHEYRAPRLAVEPVLIRLKPPSQSEREQALALLGMERRALTVEQAERMDGAADLWVLMTELTKGARLDDVIAESLTFLSQARPFVYRAYEYLCFAYSLGVAVPTSLIERLDEEGRFHDLPNQAGAAGLVFYDEKGSSRIRPGHQRRAQAARRLYESSRGGSVVLRELVNAVDSSQPEERLFLSVLVRGVLRNASAVLRPVQADVEDSMRPCVAHASSITELNEWRTTWNQLGRYDEAERCVDLSLAREPVTSFECNLTLGFLRVRDREDQALPMINRWVASHPDDWGVRPAQMKMLARYGGDEDIANAILETGEWLARNDQDRYVRTAHIRFVEEKGSREQISAEIGRLQEWLARHPAAGDVRAAFLGMVERKGSAQQIALAVAAAAEVISSGSAGNDVRTAFLALIDRVGTDQQVKQAIEDTETWLQAHDDATDVRTAYIAIVDRRGSGEQVAQAIAHQSNWLQKHPVATDVGERMVTFLMNQNASAQAKELATTLFAANPTDGNLAAQFIDVVLEGVADAENARERFQKMKQTVHTPRVRLAWARWFEARKLDEDAEKIYADLIREQPESFGLLYNYGRFLLDRHRYPEAAECFRQVLKVHVGHERAHDGLGRALMGLAYDAQVPVEDGEQQAMTPQGRHYWAEAELEIGSAVFWAGRNGRVMGPYLTHLGWYYNESERYEEALGAFSRAIEESSEWFQNFWGSGHALAGLGRWSEASSALRTALSSAPQPLSPPASEEIPRLLAHCEAAAQPRTKRRI